MPDAVPLEDVLARLRQLWPLLSPASQRALAEFLDSPDGVAKLGRYVRQKWFTDPNTWPPDQQLLVDGTMSIEQAAAFTGYSRDGIERILDEGGLPWTQIRSRGRRLIPRRAIVALMEKLMVNGGVVDVSQ